jgi:hypothetical protein
MGRLRAMVRSALDDRSPRFVLATIALGVAVALLAGFAIGYKVDDSNGKGGKRATTVKNGGKNGKGGGGKGGGVKLKNAEPLVGTVNAVKGKRLNVTDLGANKKRSLGVGRKTHIYAVKTVQASDIKVGDRVLFQPSSSSETTATEIVVLPGKARIGFPVSAVKSGSMTVATSLSGTTDITTTGAVVRKTHAGNRKGITKGDKVYVRYFVVRGRRTQATDVVVLPKDSKFQ